MGAGGGEVHQEGPGGERMLGGGPHAGAGQPGDCHTDPHAAPQHRQGRPPFKSWTMIK